VLKILSIIAYKVKNSDPDRIELYFTTTKEVTRHRKSSSLYKITVSRNPLHRIKPNGIRLKSNMEWRMGQILEQYQQKMRLMGSGGRGVNKLNLYVLTDANWQPQAEPENCIKNLVATLDELRMAKDQVGIQFIQFGKDPVGSELLEKLDSRMDLPR
jgi:hypothetical protein